MHVVSSCSGITRIKRRAAKRRPVSVNVDSSLSHLAKALFGSNAGILPSISSPLAGRGGEGQWDLSDSFIVNQVKTGGSSSKKHLFLDDSGLLADYKMLAVSSPFQAQARYTHYSVALEYLIGY